MLQASFSYSKAATHVIGGLCADFARINQQYGDRYQPLALEKIVSVGALAPDNQLGMNDTTHTIAALIQLGALNLPVSPTSRHQIVNLHTGGNFLKSPPRADILLIHFIPDESISGISTNPDHPALKVSPGHTLKGVWRNAAIESGAPIVITYGNTGREIGPAHFTEPPSPFIRLPSGELARQRRFEETGDDRVPNGAMLIHRDYAKKLLDTPIYSGLARWLETELTPPLST